MGENVIEEIVLWYVILFIKTFWLYFHNFGMEFYQCILLNPYMIHSFINYSTYYMQHYQ